MNLCEVHAAELMLDKAKKRRSDQPTCEHGSHTLLFSGAGRLQHDSRMVDDTSVSWQHTKRVLRKERALILFPLHHHPMSTTSTLTTLHQYILYTCMAEQTHILRHYQHVCHKLTRTSTYKCVTQRRREKLWLLTATCKLPHFVWSHSTQKRLGSQTKHTSGNYGQTVRRFTVQKTGSGYQLH